MDPYFSSNPFGGQNFRPSGFFFMPQDSGEQLKNNNGQFTQGNQNSFHSGSIGMDPFQFGLNFQPPSFSNESNNPAGSMGGQLSNMGFPLQNQGLMPSDLFGGQFSNFSLPSSFLNGFNGGTTASDFLLPQGDPSYFSGNMRNDGDFHGNSFDPSKMTFDGLFNSGNNSLLLGSLGLLNNYGGLQNNFNSIPSFESQHGGAHNLQRNMSPFENLAKGLPQHEFNGLELQNSTAMMPGPAMDSRFTMEPLKKTRETQITVSEQESAKNLKETDLIMKAADSIISKIESYFEELAKSIDGRPKIRGASVNSSDHTPEEVSISKHIPVPEPFSLGSSKGLILEENDSIDSDSVTFFQILIRLPVFI